VSEREQPDLDQVRDAMREHDERAEALAREEDERAGEEDERAEESGEPGDEPAEPAEPG
jgi:hypothetical protein